MVVCGAGAGLAGWTSSLPFGAQLVSAAGVAVVLAVLAWHIAVRARRWDWRLVPEPSPSGILLGLGISLAAVGTATGLWLTLFGIDAAILGVIALVAELRGHLPRPPARD